MAKEKSRQKIILFWLPKVLHLCKQSLKMSKTEILIPKKSKTFCNPFLANNEHSPFRPVEEFDGKGDKKTKTTTSCY